MTRVFITIDDVRLANAKLIAGVRPDFSSYPENVQAVVKALEADLPRRLEEAGRQALHDLNRMVAA